MVRTTPDDDSDRKLLADIQEFGWHLVAIQDDEEGPAYVFSVGLYHTLGHPEICIFGLSDVQIMGQIINDIGDRVRAGRSFADGDVSTEILADYSCMFRKVSPSWYREYFGYDRWYYEGDDFPLLQCVWPDKSGYYPWQAEYNSQLLWAQPILDEPSAWPFAGAKNSAVFTTRQVLEENHPILYVAHDEDGDWQFLCGTTNEEADARVVSLKNIVDLFPTLAELADLPIGWYACRDSVDEPWQREPDES
ncbi:DUF4262 domain-containing protein [Blastopirellula marina]|nr:DUF4262 domain-containing protein [Blastopirellula marina]